MKTWMIVVLAVLGVLIALLVVLYIVGRKMMRKQDEQKAQLEAAKQAVTMLVIDKRRMRVVDAGLPQAVMSQVPKRMMKAKLPIVKAKVGPQMMTFIADDPIFDSIPVKKEVRAQVSGLYILSVRGLHGNTIVEPPKDKKAAKRAARLAKARAASAELDAERAASKARKEAKKAGKK